jgi:hypothetical protein
MSSQENQGHEHQTAHAQASGKDDLDALIRFFSLEEFEDDEEEKDEQRTDERRIDDQRWSERLAATARAECRRRTLALDTPSAHSELPAIWRQLCKMDRPEMLMWLAQLEAGERPAVVPSQEELAEKSDEDLRLLVLQLDHQRSTAD